VKAYLFVDAGLPYPGKTRLDEMETTVPGGYLLFTQRYRHYLEQAQRAGWPSRTLAAGHFHMLVEPVAMATTLVELMKM
jgi:hypothetical protein